MSPARRQSLRSIMVLAWDLYRTALRSSEPRTFADALQGAWKWTKGAAARIAALPRWATATNDRSLSLGTMLQSPIRRSLTGQRYANTRAARAGYVTSMLGR